MSNDDVRGTAIGYAINLQMDYGNGRQATISGTLPLGATLEEMNAELDKLRKATNRQCAYINLRDVENTIIMAEKAVAGLELALKTYDETMEKEMESLASGPKAQHSQTKAQLENMRSQATNHKLVKQDEIQRNKTDIEKGKAMLARLKEEIEG